MTDGVRDRTAPGATAIGIDVGATKIAAGLVDLESGAILTERIVATPHAEGGAAVMARIVETAEAAFADAQALGGAPIGIGLGVPELVDNEGRVASRWNFDWRGIDPAKALGGLGPVVVESDVRAAALGEIRFGHGRTLPSFVYVSAGSGLSYSLCDHGRVHRGANGFAIHFGSSDIAAVDPETGRQSLFNLEGYASGIGMGATLSAALGHPVDTRDIVGGRAGEAGAELLEKATKALASFLGQMVNMLDPHGIVIGGGLGSAPAYFDRVAAKVPGFIWAEACRGLPILQSALGPRAGIVGAAAACAALAETRIA